MLWLVVASFLVCGAFTLWLIGERGHLILPSTRRGFREQGWRSVLRPQIWHLYVYGRWPTLYIGGLIHGVFRLLAAFGRGGRNWLAQQYHGKVLIREHAHALITVDRTLPLRDLDRVIPYRTARLMLLQSPLEIAVYECPCRLARAQRCHPTQVCMIIGQPFVDLVLEHHPHTSRRLSSAEALELLDAEHERGHVHMAWFKDACLHRFFAICNCCKCCCGGIDAMVHYGIPMIASSGFVAVNDPGKCVACGACVERCAFGAIRLHDHAVVSYQQCKGCGVCVDHCRAGAMTLVRDPGQGVPLDVRQWPDSS
jgi:Pyruvate/2-oxoacid:ferredoxin oxidoreductase delta subunit